jgi:hypothetical protein
MREAVRPSDGIHVSFVPQVNALYTLWMRRLNVVRIATQLRINCALKKHKDPKL